MPSRLGRLKTRPEFLRVAASGRKWAEPGLVLQMGPESGEDEPLRVGFTVSKKVGNAVKRNRARRRLKAAVEAVMPLHAAPGRDYVVIGRGKTVHRSFDMLLLDLQRALKRLKAYRDQEEGERT